MVYDPQEEHFEVPDLPVEEAPEENVAPFGPPRPERSILISARMRSLRNNLIDSSISQIGAAYSVS